MSATYTQDVLEGLGNDPSPRAVEARELIRQAIHAAAAEDRGSRVHITRIRFHLSKTLPPRFLGGAISKLVRGGYLVPTGRYRPNGDVQAGNAAKPAPIYKLMRPIPPETPREDIR